MGLINDDNFEIGPHFLEFPCQVIGNNQYLSSVPQSGAPFGIDLHLILLDMLAIPIEYLIIPVISQGGWADDHHRPFITIHISDGKRLDCLAHTHLISQQHPPMVLYSELQ